MHAAEKQVTYVRKKIPRGGNCLEKLYELLSSWYLGEYKGELGNNE